MIRSTSDAENRTINLISITILICSFKKQRGSHLFSFFFMKIPAKLFTLHILEFDRNAGDGKNNFYSFLLQISVETFQRAPGNDPADYISGEIQLEKPECRIHVDFQNRIPRHDNRYRPSWRSPGFHAACGPDLMGDRPM